MLRESAAVQSVGDASAAITDRKSAPAALDEAARGVLYRKLLALCEEALPNRGDELARNFVECVFVLRADDKREQGDPAALCLDETRAGAEIGRHLMRLWDTRPAIGRLFHEFSMANGFAPRFGHRIEWLDPHVAGDAPAWPEVVHTDCVTSAGSPNAKAVKELALRIKQLFEYLKLGAQLNCSAAARELFKGVGHVDGHGLACIDFRSCYHLVVSKLGWEKAFEVIQAIRDDPQVEKMLVTHGSRWAQWRDQRDHARVIAPMRPVAREPMQLQLARKAFFTEGRYFLKGKPDAEVERLLQACWEIAWVSGNVARIDYSRMSAADHREIGQCAQELLDSLTKRIREADVEIDCVQSYVCSEPLSWRELARAKGVENPGEIAVDRIASFLYPENPRHGEVRKVAIQLLSDCVRIIGATKVAVVDLTRFEGAPMLADRDFDADALCRAVQKALPDLELAYQLLPVHTAGQHPRREGKEEAPVDPTAPLPPLPAHG